MTSHETSQPDDGASRPDRPSSPEPELVRLATIGPAHGLAGDVRLVLHTDLPQQRLAPGEQVRTDPDTAGPLTVAGLRTHSGQYLARFEGYPDRTAAEALRGLVLLAAPETEADAWYPYELRGLRAISPDGRHLGTIETVQHLPAQDALVLRVPGGDTVLVPFVTAIVPVVDVPGGTVTIDAPGGLLPEPEPEQHS